VTKKWLPGNTFSANPPLVCSRHAAKRTDVDLVVVDTAESGDPATECRLVGAPIRSLGAV
jgi:hypothetical protein